MIEQKRRHTFNKELKYLTIAVMRPDYKITFKITALNTSIWLNSNYIRAEGKGKTSLLFQKPIKFYQFL